MPISLNGSTGIQFPDSSIQAAAASPNVLKNRIINGDMRIDQRNAGAAITPTATTYTLDRWRAQISQASKLTFQQNAASVTPPAGFTNYLGVTVASAYSITASDFFEIDQPIEGFNIADLAWGTASAKTVTLSFWVRSSLTGTFGGSLIGALAYPFTYTISSANTWEQKTITIAGPTTGAWTTNNGQGFTTVFSLGMGSDRTSTAGSWQSGNFLSVTGATSVVGTLGATFYITGVQLEVGSTATPFERRLYNQELANCQRYYYKVTPAGITSLAVAYNQSTTVANGTIYFAVSMRTNPSALEQSGTASHYRIAHQATATNCSSVPTFSTATTEASQVTFTVSSGLTAGDASSLQTTGASGYLAWSAEL
jgi:hypothetical protein